MSVKIAGESVFGMSIGVPRSLPRMKCSSAECHGMTMRRCAKHRSKACCRTCKSCDICKQYEVLGVTPEWNAPAIPVLDILFEYFQVEKAKSRKSKMQEELARLDLEEEADGEEWNVTLWPEQKDEDYEDEPLFHINGRNCKKCGDYIVDFGNNQEIYQKHLAEFGWDQSTMDGFTKNLKFFVKPVCIVCKCKAN